MRGRALQPLEMLPMSKPAESVAAKCAADILLEAQRRDGCRSQAGSGSKGRKRPFLSEFCAPSGRRTKNRPEC